MKTLALEMSTARGSVAFHDGESVLFEASFAADRKHSGAFFANVELCLRRAGPPRQIIVGVGPGSYAGTRIAIATALGLRSSTGAKLAGIPSICALEIESRNYYVVGDARRQSFFLAQVKDRRLVAEPILESAAGLEARLSEIAIPIFASEELPQFPQAKRAYPTASRLAEIATSVGNEIRDVELLEPIYLRPPHITTPKQG